MSLISISKSLPSKIDGHYGELTIVKRKNKAFYCFYPGAVKEKIPVMKDKTLEGVVRKMHDALTIKGIINKPVPKSKKKKNSKKLHPNKRINVKLKAQKRAFDKK